jgi:hypothetical protein
MTCAKCIASATICVYSSSVPPPPLRADTTASVKDPFGNVLMLLDRTMEQAADVEDASVPSGALFANVEVDDRRSPSRGNRELLLKLYESVGRTADDLPYTPHFESLYNGYVDGLETTEKPTRSDVWRHLLNLRKGGNLPKLGEARSTPPPITDEMKEKLRSMLGTHIGRRDRLPYTERFDKLVDEFNREAGRGSRKLSPHLVWRLVATLAK